MVASAGATSAGAAADDDLDCLAVLAVQYEHVIDPANASFTLSHVARRLVKLCRCCCCAAD